VRRIGEPTVPDIELELAELSKLSRGLLVERWRAFYRSDPPKGVSRRFLVLAVAYGMQAKRYGGLKPAVARSLLKVAVGTPSDGKMQPASKPRVRAGARLIREWNGTTHVVDVVDGGYLWNGQRHRSLSAIARAITGTRWSGPRFFGIGSGKEP
jgi:hypothetical protein